MYWKNERPRQFELLRYHTTDDGGSWTRNRYSIWKLINGSRKKSSKFVLDFAPKMGCRYKWTNSREWEFLLVFLELIHPWYLNATFCFLNASFVPCWQHQCFDSLASCRKTDYLLLPNPIYDMVMDHSILPLIEMPYVFHIRSDPFHEDIYFLGHATHDEFYRLINQLPAPNRDTLAFLMLHFRK